MLGKRINKLKYINRRELLKSGVLGLSGLLGISGCGINLPGPGGRLGCAPNQTIITSYLGENAAKKQRGIAYTCKAGNIDQAHVRKYAEWTEYFAKKSSTNLKNKNNKFSFKGREPGEYNISLIYPSNWKNLNENKREEIVKNTSIEIGQNLAYTMSIWHETLTYLGYSTYSFIPEFNSAFSWEDRFSDTFGCYVGGLALQKGGKFQKALQSILNKEYNRLDVQPLKVTKQSIKNIKGDWFNGKGFKSKMNIRTLDLGYDDGFVTPPVPPTSKCKGVKIWACPVPNFNQTNKYGFEVEISITPKGKQGNEILRIAKQSEKIIPKTDFPKIMNHIKDDAISRGYKVIY